MRSYQEPPTSAEDEPKLPSSLDVTSIAPDERGFRARAAGLLRDVANDLKRDEVTAARELNLGPTVLENLLRGDAPFDWAVAKRIAITWPVNERDLVPMRNDTDRGRVLFRQADSVASARRLKRGGAAYYEYRDTAMSTLASFRPEWIRMLVTVEDDDPDNPAVQWNEGHLLYQFTYFVGPVNYYYEHEGVRHCVKMNTGDSVWGRPYVPHTFTSRSATEPAFILALTYGAELAGDAHHEVAALGPATASALALPASTRAAVARVLGDFLNAVAMPIEALAASCGLSADLLRDVLAAERDLDVGEAQHVANALGLHVRELLVPNCATEGARVLRRDEAPSWKYPADRPDYDVSRLAGDSFHPHVNGLEVKPLRSAPDRASWLATNQHQYFNCLEGEAELRWVYEGTEYADRLEQGDSLYIAPCVPTSFTRGANEQAGKTTLICLRAGGKVSLDTRLALGALDEQGLRRFTKEDRRWYRGNVPK